MNTHPGLEPYGKLIDSLGQETIAEYDRQESVAYEHEQGGGAYTFGALCRSDQAAILHAISANLTPSNGITPNMPNSYDVKHAIERYTGFYVSNLQAKVALRVMGFEKDGKGVTPRYGVSVSSWRKFTALSHTLAERRRAAHERMARQREAQACARFFTKLSA